MKADYINGDYDLSGMSRWLPVVFPLIRLPLEPAVLFFLLAGFVCWPHFSTGQKIEMRLVHIFEMRDGKISKEIVFDMGRPA
jgi:hypothetical protein